MISSPRPVDGSITQVDVMVQTTVPNTDIMFVVDNSCSMGDDQQRLVDNFPSFARWFLGSGLDYHIGVVSTDMDDPAQRGKLQQGFGRKWIEADDPNQINTFTQMAVLGVSGSPTEKGTDAAYAALEIERDGFNEGFYRDEAAIHTIVVADEADYSGINEREFINWYDGLKRVADERTFSIIWDPASLGFGGRSYAPFNRQIGGVYYQIRETDWSSALDVLGLQATGMKTEYFLSRAPVEDSIEVAVRLPILDGGDFTPQSFPRAEFDDEGNAIDENGDPITEPHYYYVPERNSIRFLEYVPEEAYQIQISYTVRSSSLL